MSTFRIALANLRFPAAPEESLVLAEPAIAHAAREQSGVICFPDCFVPGCRSPEKSLPPPDAAFLEHAWSVIAAAARRAGLAVVLGTGRIVNHHLPSI
jgi:predicted amidohydrolase